MFEPRHKLYTPEFTFSCWLALLGLVITLVVNIFPLTPKYWQEIGTAIGTAILAACFVNITHMVFGFWSYKNQVFRFERFWGQRIERHAPGAIFLQSDRIESLLRQLGGGDANALLERLDHPHCNDESVNRCFKARDWINKFDAESAKYIREEFLKRDFTPPGFEALDRKTIDSIGISHPRTHMDIYMGLGHTEEIADIVNNACVEISIQIDQKYGDAIFVTPGLFRQLPKGLFQPPDDTNPHHMFPLVRAGWDHSAYVNKKIANAYAFIFRYKSSKDKRVVFHVAGFTDDATAAAGKYLAERWDELYDDYFKDPNSDGNFFIILTGTVPFAPERQIWDNQYGKALANENASNAHKTSRRGRSGSPSVPSPDLAL